MLPVVSPAWLGTLPSWLSTAGIATILGIVLRYRLGSRKLTLDSEKQHDEDEKDIRDRYATEVAALRDKLDRQSTQFRQNMLGLEDRYRRLLDASEQRHEDCQRDRDALRQRINHLEDELRGLIRIIAQNSANRVLQLGGNMPEDIRAAAERVEQVLAERGRQ